MNPIHIEKNIKQATTLPSSFYNDPRVFEAVKEKIFVKTWHYIADTTALPQNSSVYPFTLLPGVLDEPLVLTKDKNGKVRCLSNVCTHRGNIIVEKAGPSRMMSCGYHGKCFRLDGNFKSMPGFQDAENFPTKKDDLPEIQVAEWLGMFFVAINPTVSFEEMIAPMQKRLDWQDFSKYSFQKETSKDYFVDANWALYCDNFLEGFHIPFVHPGLNDAIEMEQYDYVIYPYCNLQIGMAKENEAHFDLAESSVDYGQKIFAYYYWLFPNMMFNFYPWGLSMNIVEPLAQNKTTIKFRTYLNAAVGKPANNEDIDQTEMEDEAVVESVAKGIRSRLYDKGRFSPSMEQGVHHFHLLASEWISR